MTEEELLAQSLSFKLGWLLAAGCWAVQFEAYLLWLRIQICYQIAVLCYIRQMIFFNQIRYSFLKSLLSHGLDGLAFLTIILFFSVAATIGHR